MRIGIDARFLNESGVGRYLRNLITNLKVLDKKNSYFIFLLPKDYNQFQDNRNFKKVAANFSWYGFAEQFNLPKLLNKYKLDLVHFPHFNVPIFYTGKFVVTIHDLIHQHHAMKRASALNPFAFKIKQIGYKRVFKEAVGNSQKIFVPSTYVKNLLQDEWKIKEEKIVITPEAVDEKLLLNIKIFSDKKAVRILEKFDIKRPFIFYVGNAHPHKNVEGLLTAFLELRKKYQYLTLVLAGYDHYFWERIKKENPHKDIKFVGNINDEELVALYKTAKVFVMPSLEEGFGLPLLEAQACGCLVVSSNAGSLKEVGGDAAIYFDPADKDDLKEKISLGLNSLNLREELIAKGLKRYKSFSWKKLAKQTLKGYEECVSH